MLRHEHNVRSAIIADLAESIFRAARCTKNVMFKRYEARRLLYDPKDLSEHDIKDDVFTYDALIEELEREAKEAVDRVRMYFMNHRKYALEYKPLIDKRREEYDELSEEEQKALADEIGF